MNRTIKIFFLILFPVIIVGYFFTPYPSYNKEKIHVSGLVLDNSNNPVANTIIRYNDVEMLGISIPTSKDPIVITSDKDGKFSFTSVHTSSTNLLFEKEGFRSFGLVINHQPELPKHSHVTIFLTQKK